ncbi:mhyt domain signaling protein [Diplodia corticola]|uniref:Mhyt domain signaling protein n=1 Tax=Diplodia corticola TaxID=236234 RepID=A0A1J9RM18_9PEZI|nr:mhyt domain signaling protein [Diplodia corticola]OJD33619.1 mhyt domain signaling protein [Diplodia corticola]
MGQVTDPHTSYMIGEMVPFHVDPWIIVASWFVSFVGSTATVELLHRRGSGQGWRNWLQLGACSVSFGVVGIWCMHFVGNRAIELGDGSKEIQLYYSPGFTTLSVFLPVIFLFLGFTVAERFNRTARSLYLSLGITGIFAGLAIVGMHYIGNLGTTTYSLQNDYRHIIGAALIATFSCYVAITLFFHQKEQWINTWARRIPVAAILATAVCGMHWTAAAGTSYRLKQFYHGNERARNNNMIVAIFLCVAALCVCFLLLWLTSRRRRQLADRAQHVVLASATFDMDGKILVTQEGLLPCQKITRKYNQRSFNDEFNVAHPVFQWIFRVTHNWDSVAEFIGIMRQHLRAVGSLRDPSTPTSRGKTLPQEKDGPLPEVDYSVIFREHFCVAAAELASNMGTDIQNLGTLWEDILMTGTTVAEVKTKTVRRSSKAPSEDVEAAAGLTIPAPALFGRGQLMFVVRQLQKKEECADLIASGYRWATIDQVGDLLSRSMQVSRLELSRTVERLRKFNSRQDGLSNPGTWLAFFAMRPALKPSSGSWDVLVPKDEPYHLPKVNISEDAPQDSTFPLLHRMNNLSIADCLRFLNSGLNAQKTEKVWTEDQAAFAERMRDGINQLQQAVPEQFFRSALFSARPMRDYTAGTPRPGTIFSFCIIPDVHISSIKSAQLMYTPLSFFRCRQRIHRGSPDHAVLAHCIHREFNEIRAQQQKDNGQKASKIGSSRPLSRQSIGMPRFSSRSGRSSPKPKSGGLKSWLGGMSGANSRRDSGLQPDSASERELVSMDDMLKRISAETCDRDRDRDRNRNHSVSLPYGGRCGGGGGLGGIMVSQDIRIDDGGKEDSVMQLTELGVRSEAGQGGKEEDTFADELFEITSAAWRRS